MQKDLFGDDTEKPMNNVQNIVNLRENEHEWNQFCRLGEMIGDGLHYESDGKWITKEYARLAKILIPELKEKDKAKRKLKAISINEQMAKLLETKKCACGGNLKQKRSGTKIAYCDTCNTRYKATRKK